MQTPSLGATALALVAGGVAQAADMPAAPIVKAPPPPSIDWGGFYFGGHAGFAWSDVGFTFTDDVPNSEDLRFSPSGISTATPVRGSRRAVILFGPQALLVDVASRRFERARVARVASACSRWAAYRVTPSRRVPERLVPRRSVSRRSSNRFSGLAVCGGLRRPSTARIA